MILAPAVRVKYNRIIPHFNEKQQRLYAASEALVLGHGGISAVSRATGISRPRITRGIRDLTNQTRPPVPKDRIRRIGGGRKRIEDQHPELLPELESLIDGQTRGDPESLLKWTSKSVLKLAKALRTRGYRIGDTTVGRVLKDQDYSLQANAKIKEGKNHPDRDAQFRHINNQAKKYLEKGQPVISVDCKKKELVGNYKNSGREWRPKGKPEQVKVYDFVDKDLGKAIPYGIYDVAQNKGFVNVGISRETAEFAVESIRKWWNKVGQHYYPQASKLMITADCGGSNGRRVRLWKRELQELANQTGLKITVCHYPPGTSKWNKIEHRMFSYISINWRGKPLRNLQIILKLIGSTTTKTGLKIQADLNKKEYQARIKVSDQEMKKINLERHKFCKDWNYTIRPNL